MQPKQGTPLDRFFQNILLFLSLTFIIWFIIDQWQGIQMMLDYILDAIRSIPDFTHKIRLYFEAAPPDQLQESLLVGGIFGAVSTAIIYLAAGKGARLQNFNLLRTFIAILSGAIAGAIGAQILNYPLQHCTFSPEFRAEQYRIGLFATALSAMVLLLPTWTLLLNNGRIMRQQNQSTAGYFQNKWLPYLFLLPTLLFLVLFLYYPATQIFTVSLKDILRLGARIRERDVCLANYVQLTTDPVYENSFTVTLVITTFLVLFSLALALAIAVLASQKIKGAAVYRTLLIWPYAISPVVTGVIFMAMFREGGAGLLNRVLYTLFETRVNWLTDADIAPWVIIAASVWNVLGFNVLFYIAGLQNVPEDLLEAAALDGANRVQRFFYITFPLLTPFTFFLLVTNITFAFYGIYGVVDVLTQGGPVLGAAGTEGGATEVLIYKLYEDAGRTSPTAGFAGAQAIVLFFMVAALTLLQFRYVERRVTYGE